MKIYPLLIAIGSLTLQAQPPFTPNSTTERAPKREPTVRPRYFQLCDLTHDLKQTCAGFTIGGASRDQVSINTEPGGKITIEWTRTIARQTRTTTYVGTKVPGKGVYAGQVTLADGSPGTWKGAFSDELAIFDDALITSKTPEVVSKLELDVREMNRQRKASGYDPSKDPVVALLAGSVAAAVNKKPEAPGFGPKEGWGKVKWGMTKAQVKQAYPQAREFAGGGRRMLYGLERFNLEGAVMKVDFQFTDGGLLKTVSLSFNKDEAQPPNDIVEDIERDLQSQFTKIFGRPETKKPIPEATDYTWPSESQFVHMTTISGTDDRDVYRTNANPLGDTIYVSTAKGRQATFTVTLSKY